ncbi:hypothetical protein [Nevskia sp.]|uniref:hypothetical protein n=1 Tax=Nevskia sp. TaxID=1929292 RepID=UPI003F727ACC
MPDLTPSQQRNLSRLLNRALANAWDKLAALDAESQRLVLAEYQAAAEEIVAGLQVAADRQGNVGVAGLQAVIGRVTLALEALRTANQALAEQQVFKAAVIGAGAVEELRKLAINGEIVRESVARLPDAAAVADAVRQQLIHQPGDDGLTLSDRIWRNHRELRDELMPAIQRAVIQGEDARSAVRDALVRAGTATAEEIRQIEAAKAGVLGDEARAILTGPKAKAYANALRVVRTESDRANIMSSREAIYAVEGVVGTRFLLSPAHPRFDICDLHADVNLYGLGKGVYPRGKSPLPAHPNTLSYEEAVFEWEVTPEDREGRDDPIEWLKARSAAEQLGVLQSRDKLQVLDQLTPADITTPWRVLAPRFGGTAAAQ